MYYILRISVNVVKKKRENDVVSIKMSIFAYLKVVNRLSCERRLLRQLKFFIIFSELVS